MSQLKKVISGLTFDKEKNSVPKLYRVFKRNESLKQGYREMASLNLSLAQMCQVADNDALSACEEKLTECE